ncbi:MAG: DUF2309 domain-containing protein [Acidobacteria bacterium]|nr:DUF2309 domain-containing protein [Acidobacteriota bacterium]MDA1234022.1 DUF2309 domain-containing protein [Acidobacteriota bacterium]
MRTLSAEERDGVRQQVEEACQPVAQLWPLRTFAYRSPVRGYEYLPFDEAVRAAHHTLGGVGYLPNHEYRGFYQEGRIKDENVARALTRMGPSVDSDAVVTVGSRRITAAEVLRIHLLSGIEALEPKLLEWTLKAEGLMNSLTTDVPGGDLWNAILSVLDEDRLVAVHQDSTLGEESLGLRTLGDWLDARGGASIVEQVNGEMIKWSAAFLDEGLAGWGMPDRSQGFYRSWRELAAHDASGRLLGVRDFGAKVRALPDAPEDAVAWCLNTLEVPEANWKDYQSRQFAQLPGWTGFVRWRGENPEYPSQQEYPIDLVEYLAVRLFYEVVLVNAFCKRAWGIPGTLSAIKPKLAETETHEEAPRTVMLCRSAWRLFRLSQHLELAAEDVARLSEADVRTLLGWLDAFPAEDHGRVWLEAYEDAYRDGLVGKLSAHESMVAKAERPRAQLILCIDARSEPFRRHIEASGSYETFGYAGFFGVPMSHQAFDSAERLALCPVLLKPGHAVAETFRPGEPGPMQAYASGTRWRRLGDDLFHDLKQNLLTSFMLVDALGLLFSIGLTGKSVFRKTFVNSRAWLRRGFKPALNTHIPFARTDQSASDNGLLHGFTLEEQAAFVGGGLRVIGLTKRLGKFVVACGHGAISENNPYAAAYNCGACGGAHGDPNARVFAAMANRPEVRRKLAEAGLVIPDDTWFLAAKHDTTADSVAFYDVSDVPATHTDDFRQLTRDLAEAGAIQTAERCAHLPGSPKGMSPKAAFEHAQSRGSDWANVRPEWGLSGNAAFIIGRRQITAGLDLQSRVFLHSYDHASDPEGALLEKIMTAPLIVGEWINMEYYFSAVDPWFYGSGSKVIHNVVSAGVMLGSQSDLQGGLPLQGVNNGAKHYHEPMRLLAIIEAPMERIASTIAKHAILQQVFHNGWMNLLAFDPETGLFHRYHADSSWEVMSQPRAA